MGDAKLQTKTPAEFFSENRNIAGFDNVRRPRLGAACVLRVAATCQHLDGLSLRSAPHAPRVAGRTRRGAAVHCTR